MSAKQTELFPRPTLVQPAAAQPSLPGMEQTVDEQLEAMVARYMELQPLVKEFKQLRKELLELTASERLVKAGKFEIHRNTHEAAEKFVSGHSVNRLIIR